jgi:hypothetical protein
MLIVLIGLHFQPCVAGSIGFTPGKEIRSVRRFALNDLLMAPRCDSRRPVVPGELVGWRSTADGRRPVTIMGTAAEVGDVVAVARPAATSARLVAGVSPLVDVPSGKTPGWVATRSGARADWTSRTAR